MIAEQKHRLRILHIILSLRPTNGQYNEHCLPLMDEREISICTYFKTEIKPPQQLTVFDGDNTIPGFARALRTALNAKEYDIIHVHTPHAGLLLMSTLALAGGFWKYRSKTVHTIQNSYKNFKFRNRIMHLPSFPYFKQLVFCSEASYESFPKYYKVLGGNRMVTVQNAVDLDRIDVYQNGTAQKAHDRFTVVTVGLIDMKNPSTVLNAFRSVYDGASRLIYLGDGHLRQTITAAASEAKLGSAVTLTGMIPRDSVFETFASADLFVSTSWGEGLPVAVMEAMACRLPVVLSDIPPHREITRDVDFIPLVMPGDAEGFAREIKRFREMPVSDRVEIGQKCRQLIEDQFSLPVMHSNYAEIYGRMIGKPINYARDGAG